MGRKKRKQNRNLGPRRKRMRRQARLATAPKWLSSYGGKDVVRGYGRWYAVDGLCAIKELRMLGVQVSEEYEARLRESSATIAKARAAQRARRLAAKTRPIEIEWPADWPVEWIPTDDLDDEGDGSIPF
jgi:hypothetical protein